MLNSTLFELGLLPLLIFVARISDVSLSTIRTIYIMKGYRKIAPAIGFFEVLIWLTSITIASKNLDKPIYAISYAAGFACGNYVGMWLEEKLAIGKVNIQMVCNGDTSKFLNDVRAQGFGITTLDAHGAQGPVKILFSIIERKQIPKILEAMKKHDLKAFFAVGDVRSTQEGVFPKHLPTHKKFFRRLSWGSLRR